MNRADWREWWEEERKRREAKQAKLEPIRERAAREIRLCRLRAPSMRGLSAVACSRRRICFLDGTPLPSRRSRWCSPRCSRIYWRNHGWSEARSFARLRARIGDEAAAKTYEADAPRGSWSLRPRCHRCRREVGEIEVNHRIPRNGEGYEEGCWHHQSNLEPLCHDCHVAETTRQIRERRGLVDQARPESLWGEP